MINTLDELWTKIQVEFNNRFNESEEKTDKKFKDMETKIDQRFKESEEKTDKKFKDMETKIDQRFKDMEDNIDQRFKESEEKTDKKFKDLEDKMDQNFKRVEDKLDVVTNTNMAQILTTLNETRAEFSRRLAEVSTEFNKVIRVTNWFNKQVNNSIFFINITDHTNDELKKVIMNYYYKEEVEYVFYDTLKTDIDNIGNGEEIKRTATILSNLAQNFHMFIGSTLQLSETSTDPVNLNINDLAVSRTVKEVLDTLCLFKQIHKENYDKYEYSLNEVDDTFYDLTKYDDPDERYYSCVVDKNRAGAKPTLLFSINLAYNRWTELGYLRLKNN